MSAPVRERLHHFGQRRQRLSFPESTAPGSCVGIAATSRASEADSGGDMVTWRHGKQIWHWIHIPHVCRVDEILDVG